MPADVIVGARVAAECDFRVAGVLTDPDIVLIRILAPNAVLTTITYPDPALVKEATGVYRAEFTATVPGPWAVRWEGSGSVEAVSETAINVNASSVI